MNKILGGAGGGGSSPTIVSDSLRSQDSIEFVLGVCEGPIAGLVNGPKSFYLNDTPLVSATGENNFEGFELHMYHGAADPTRIVPKFGGASTNVQVGVLLAQYVPVVRTTPQNLRGLIDRLEVRIVINQLVKTNDKGDQLEHTAQFRLKYKRSDEVNWRALMDTEVVTVTGKTGSSYVKEYVRSIPVADRSYTGDWEISVEKLNDENNDNLFCSATFESYQCIQTDTKLQFPNLVCARGLGASSNQFSSIPTFSGIYAGKIIRIPSNYSPITRYYDGLWDGTFQWGYSDNPAWCLYDMIQDENYGFKKHYPEIMVDRWSFYEAAQWCDVLVPRRGATGYQPRYTYHDLIDQVRGGVEAAQYVASIFGGIITTDLNGSVRLKLDKPGTPVQIFGPESVTIEGFQYQFADIASRANDYLVTFINPDLKWNQDVRQVKVDSYIAKNGRIPMDFVAVGCIDAYEAQRRALLRLISANTEVTTVTFSTTRPGILLEPFDIIGITDPYMNWGLSGRIKSTLNGVITLRDPLFLSPDAEYNMTVQSKTGPVDLVVRNTGGAVSTQLTRVSGSLLQDIPTSAQFALTSNTVGLVKPFRILSIAEGDTGQDTFTITAIEINTNKYADADELDISPEATQAYSFERSAFPKAPVNVSCDSGTNELYLTSSGQVNSRIRVSWDHDPQSFVNEYEVYYKRLDRDVYSKLLVTGTEAYINNVQDGMTYQVYVRAINTIGNRSASSAVVSHVVLGKTVPPTTPASGTTSQLLTDVRVDWSDITDLDFSFYEIRIGGTSWATATRLGTSTTSVFTHANVSGSTIVYRIKSVDTSGNYSTGELVLTHSVQQPGAPTLAFDILGSNYRLSITPPSNITVPIREYVITLDNVEIFRGAVTSYTAPLTWTGTRTFRVSAVNMASVQSAEFALPVTVTKPATIATLTGTVNEGILNLSWNVPASDLPIQRYIVRNKTSGVVLDSDLKATSYAVPITWTGVRQFDVWAVNSAGIAGDPTTFSYTVVAPSVINVQSQLLKSVLNLSWSGVRGTLPIKQYKVLNATTGVLLATIDAQNWSTPVDWNGTRSFAIVAEDINGNASAQTTVSETVDPPAAPAVTNVIVDKSLRLTWTEPTSELRIREYEVWRDSVIVQKVSGTSTLVPIDFAGSKTYSVRAVDEAGNLGAYGTTTRTINAPTGLVLDASIVSDSVRLSWNVPTSTLPISEYILMRGAANTVITRLAANGYTLRADFVGIETFKIQAVDIAGNTSVVFTDTIEVIAPTAPVLKQEVLDNNVLLRWTNGTGTLPIRNSEVRRGATFATAQFLQQVDATFAPFFEFQSGTYTYWVVNIDTAGNYGTPTAVSAVVSQPQDFVLQANFDSTFGGTKTRCHLDGGKLYFGVSSTETYEQHWTSVANSTVQDQISDGYPYWLQPSTGLASSYEETFDYGTVLASSLITITPTIELALGSAALTVDIDVKAAAGDAWTSLTVGNPQGFATNFRYVRFTLRVSGDTKDDLLVVSQLNVRLNTKTKSASGNGTANAADAGGTTVNFGADFIDVQSISVTPLSTTARFAVYDFVDVPYPTSFKVLMYDVNGNRVSGNFSWSARGY